MGVWDYKSLKEHQGHKLECVIYGREHSASIECMDCMAVLLSYDNPSKWFECSGCRAKDKTENGHKYRDAHLCVACDDDRKEMNKLSRNLHGKKKTKRKSVRRGV